MTDPTGSPFDSFARVRALREQATRLRRIADELNDEATALERSTSTLPLIGGARLADAAVLALADANQPVHYRDLADQIQQRTSHRIRGADAGATLLANIDRDSRITRVGSRTGLYRLAAPNAGS